MRKVLVITSNQYRCPLCSSPLSREQYERALQVQAGKEQDIVAHAHHEGEQRERQRVHRLLAGKDDKIRQLQATVRQLEKGSTPQTEGLEYEDKLVTRLIDEFPADIIEHKGHVYDVLQLVMSNGGVAGTIVYECKQTATIQSAHIDQAHKAKQTCKADFAILVTSGRRKGFGGYTEVDGVLVVSPLVVISVVSFLRRQLVTMLRLNLTQDQRSIVAQTVLEYVNSPQFRNRVEDVFVRAQNLADQMKREMQFHLRDWRARSREYQVIGWDADQIQKDFEQLLQGKRIKPAVAPREAPLQLPMPGGTTR